MARYQLTAQDRATLKAFIIADPTLGPISSGPNTNYDTIANVLSANAAPQFIVWKPLVQTTEVGQTVSYVAVVSMTDANRGRITTFIGMNPSSFSPERSDIRTYWADTFSGALGGEGQATRDALEALWRRPARLAEKVLATGTGTTLSPAVLGYEGTISIGDVSLIING